MNNENENQVDAEFEIVDPEVQTSEDKIVEIKVKEPVALVMIDRYYLMELLKVSEEDAIDIIENKFDKTHESVLQDLINAYFITHFKSKEEKEETE